MDALSHYHRAEELLRHAADSEADAGDYDPAPTLAAMAQAHATLALAGVTALSGGFDGPPLEDYHAWFKVASIAAPIPPETDDDEEPGCDIVRVGSVSPTDPAALGEWLRERPFATILRDDRGHAWERNTGVVAGGGVQRKFPTLVYALSGRAFELTDGHVDLEAVARYASFTVLALGDGTADVDNVA